MIVHRWKTEKGQSKHIGFNQSGGHRSGPKRFSGKTHTGPGGPWCACCQPNVGHNGKMRRRHERKAFATYAIKSEFFAWEGIFPQRGAYRLCTGNLEAARPMPDEEEEQAWSDLREDLEQFAREWDEWWEEMGL